MRPHHTITSITILALDDYHLSYPTSHQTQLNTILLKIRSIEHSENRIITLFELFDNKIGPGVLQLTVQKICTLQENQGHKESATENVSIMSLFCGILLEYMFDERWTSHSRSNLVSEIRNHFIFEMLY